MRTPRNLGTATVILSAVSLLSLRPAMAQIAWHVARTIQVGGAGGMDYLTVDAATHRLFVPRSTHTMVIDSVSGKTLADIPGQKRSHGVALVPQLNRWFITDGVNGSIVIFDLKSYAILGTVMALPDADGIIYDAASNLILVSAGDSNSLITLKPDVDPKTGKIDTPIALGGAPEFLAADGAGKVYVNLEDKDNVAVVDLKMRKVIAHWPVSPGGAPVGMAIDKAHQTLVIGCRKPQKMVVISMQSGKVLADLPIGAGVDATQVAADEYFASSGDGTLAVVGSSPTEQYHTVQTVKTPVGAKTMGIDLDAREIFLPTMDFEAPKPGASGRPAAIPGTFKIVVVARSEQ